MIDFLKGQPSLDLLPLEMFAQATTLAMADPDAREDMLQYANELGNPTFRNNLAAFLSREYGSAVSPSHLCPTSGASYGLEHAVALLTRPQTRTKYCYFQDPTYFLVFDIYRDLGFEPHQFVGIPDTKHQGLDVDHFEKTLQQHFPDVAPKSHDEKGEWIYDAVLYCVPTHANPTGSTLPEDQRERLVQLAKKYNVLVICDDVYDILTFDKKDMPRRVVAYDLDEHDPHPVVISNGSFSKILAPGARSGWLECHPKLISVLGVCGSFISGGSSSNYVNQLINQMIIASDKNVQLEAHITTLRDELHRRLMQGVWEPIQEQLVPMGCDPGPEAPRGGYFVWLRLPIGVKCQQVLAAVKTLKLDISFGATHLFRVSSVHESNKSNGQQQNGKDQKEVDDTIRLCFAHYDVQTLCNGITQLATAIDDCLKK